MAALWLHRTRQLRASVTRVAAFSCGSTREASRSQPTHPEAHSLVTHVLDGLRAKDYIGCQRLVRMRWSADLTAAPTCTAEEPIGCRGTGSRWLPIFTSRSIQVPCCPWQVALSARYGSGAARFQRAASRGLAGSRTTASGSMARRCSSSLRKTYGRGLRHHILLTPSACWTRQPCLPTRV